MICLTHIIITRITGTQHSRDVIRLEPQIAENRGSKSKKHKANVNHGAIHTDRYPRQCGQLIRSECPQVISATQEPQSVKTSQRCNDANGTWTIRVSAANKARF